MAKVSLRAYNREIETMIDRGQLDEAIAHCRHILKTYPKHLETYRLLGKAYLEYKRYGDAADIFSRILVSVPNDFVAQVGMSIIRDEENKLDDAIWHMERAFETQPSNPAIQSELQRLYGRRDGVRPPRIRMTRGALAHMYVQGELYPQAISEIRSVLNDDPGRADMQALLARACYKSGLKNEAADVATALLKRYPYSFDANRVLAEILGSEHHEGTQLYRQRVIELDPYAAQVTENIFLSSEVSDAAVNVERLDWNGQPVVMQPDWEESQAISLESGPAGDEQPDWLRPLEATPRLDDSTPAPSQPTPAPIFESASPFEQPAAQSSDDIPDFMRAAGWGESTGTFDESKSAVGAEDSSSDAPIEQGELPDWVKAMKPAEAAPAPQQSDEEIPDWINDIGAGALASRPEDQLQGASEAAPAGNLPGELDWMKDLGESEPPTAAATDDLDWIKSLDVPEGVQSSGPAETTDEADWLKGIGETESSSGMQEEQPEWLTGLAGESESLLSLPREELTEDAVPMDEEPEPSASSASASDFDFLNQLSEEPVFQTPPETTPSPVDPDNLGVSEQERDDSFAWLESLAAKQGATEGLLTTPEERLEEEPEWVKQAKGLKSEALPSDVAAEQTPASLDDLGRSEQDQDDSFAWLENLAARQGATEGLLTTPEERLEQEPEWVRRARDLSTQESQAASMPEPELSQMASMTEPEPEQPAAVDDTAAWLKGLDEAGKVSEPAPVSAEAELQEPPALDDTAAWLKSLDEGETSAEMPAPAVESKTEQPAAVDEVEAWLKDLEGEDKISESTHAADETTMWLKNLDKRESVPAQEAEPTEAEDLPAWMGVTEEVEPAAAEEPLTTGGMAEPESPWTRPGEETVQPAASTEPAEEEALPSWLSELEKEEEQISTPTDAEDLPAWLRADESTAMASEPTLSTDWKPAEGIQEEPSFEQEQPATREAPEAEPVSEVPQQQVEPEPPLIMEEPGPSAEAVVEPAQAQEGGFTPAPGIDQVLGTARDELASNNISAALDSYGRLIKKARFLDEVIYDLREALYRHPVDVNIWQSLGDAYMRANRLQDALDAYTKAEELLR